MNGINKIFIAGNLTTKPVLHKSKNGKPYSFLSIATNRFSLEDGHWNKKTDWHSIIVWGKKAELCEKYLEKGFPLAVEGYLQTTLEHKTAIVAEDLHFLGLRTTPAPETTPQENHPDPLT